MQYPAHKLFAVNSTKLCIQLAHYITAFQFWQSFKWYGHCFDSSYYRTETALTCLGMDTGLSVSGGAWNENPQAVNPLRSLEPKSVPLTLYLSSMHVGIQGLSCKILHCRRCPILFSLPVSVFIVVVYVVYIVCIYIPIFL